MFSQIFIVTSYWLHILWSDASISVYNQAMYVRFSCPKIYGFVSGAEDCKDVMSNNELSSLYSDMSPVKKKARRDVDSDLQRFLFVEGQQGQGKVF